MEDRSFFYWALGAALLWEVIGRSVCSGFWPDADLGPSRMEQILRILLTAV